MRAKLTITLLIILMVLVIATFGVLIYREQVDRTPVAIIQPTNTPIITPIPTHAHTGSPYPGAYPNRYGGAGPGCFGRSCAGTLRPNQDRQPAYGDCHTQTHRGKRHGLHADDPGQEHICGGERRSINPGQGSGLAAYLGKTWEGGRLRGVRPP